ncbi:MAG TPA: hypothetical protein ENG85_00545 [Bacteroidetes bacterium]|nr:hypothetical protein [Bacteroidota bacterium]
MPKHSGSFIFSFLLLTAFLFSMQLSAQNTERLKRAEYWADSVYQSLTPEQRIGQLIIARANYSHKPYDTRLDGYIKKYNLGGVCFFAGDPVSQAKQTNRWNSLAKTPLLVSMDAEWGLGMRLKSTLKYPLQMTLGASDDESLIYRMGQEIGRQCNRMGIQINFAPVVDVNSNPKNPVIGMRSFGENPKKVAEKAFWYMKGMEEQGVIACAKHFPGHGDTYQDSHKTLPVVNDSKKEIKKTALYPYRYLFKSHPSVSAVMVAHLSVPALEKQKNLPTSLSYRVVTKLLKKKMKFKGLVITDALDMKGVTRDYPRGEVAKMAFEAGNDLLLIPDDIPASIAKIRAAVEKNRADRKRLEESCKKILKFKYLSGAYKRTVIDTINMVTDLNRQAYRCTINRLFDQSVTVVKNDSNLLPLQDTSRIKTAIVIVGDNHKTAFETTFKQYFPARVYYLLRDAAAKDRNFVLKELPQYDLAILCVVNTNISATRRFGIPMKEAGFIQKAAKQTKTILDIFASPYALNFFKNPEDFAAILVSYQEKPQTLAASAEVITGTRKAMGRLPVSTDRFPMGSGLYVPKIRLRYGTPQSVMANTDTLKKVDSIALAGIAMKAYPGCQILAAKNGVIFYHKAFGYHTYADTLPEKMSDLYDLASLTKILATTLSLMKLDEQGIINLDQKLSYYLPVLCHSNKKDLGMKEILAHQSGLEDWIPFYESTLTGSGPDTSLYHKHIDEEHTVRVAQNMYLQKDYHYHILQQIIDSPLGEKTYKYSGLGFYLFKTMIERLTNQPLDQYLYRNFYHPMGLKRLVFTPRKFFPLEQINPTQDDTVFRKQQIWGDVHDQGAAMLGGVSGNAGLFSDAHDVAAVMQMLLNGGKYDSKEILSPMVIDIFNHRYFAADSNRRGLGFDKPMLVYEDHLSNCKSVSDRSFGHTGFTGTYTWADPENGLVYVFLSNRVFPDMYNTKIMDKDIRTNIHQLFYNAFLKSTTPPIIVKKIK